ncbi:MAG: matrixin family metalloprotease [Thaumarchaeota archaeon]|nr:matrixin family metalloprotease [Nitrososphaerota archaeon]
MTRTVVLIGFVASLLFLSLIAYSFPVFAQGQDSAPGKPEVIAVSGIVPGKDLIVHVWVVVPPGTDKHEAAAAALANQGARPFTHDEFTTIALKWDQFSDSNTGNDFVKQYYNPVDDPTGGGENALTSTHASWTNVEPSIFAFQYGGVTDRCPSLVKECRGPQTFDGFNDVAWLRLSGSTTLGVTWSGTSTDEADMALNTKFNWATDGVNDADFDVETVYLHENGHAAGLGHSEDINAIMYPYYQGPNRVLQDDDIDGINFLYPPVSNDAAPTVSITSPTSTTFTLDDFITFTATANDPEDGNLTSSLIWTSNKDGQIGTGGSFTLDTLSNNIHEITASVTDSLLNTSSDSITITVGEITTSTESSVQSIEYQLAGGKNDDKHLLITISVVDDLGASVSGADVSISISSNTSKIGWGGTATTGIDGKITFQLSNAKNGTYTTTITNVVASGLTWDGVTPANSFTK